VEACRAATDPTAIARLPSGWAVLGDPQVLRGYCLLLPDPVVPHLNALAPEAQAAFVSDMARLGQAVLELTGALRINYALFGNLEPALHAHVVPRYGDEPEWLRTAHPWAYDWTAAPRFDAVLHGDLLRALRERLARTPTPG
jgi:diadenosine tetraphosphate (Ap4A) HIT family hydrolase